MTSPETDTAAGIEPGSGPQPEPMKRPSFEPLAALTGVDSSDTAAPPKRPVTTALGAGFVMVRAVLGALWLAGLALVWDSDIATTLDLDAEASLVTLISILVVLGLAAAVLFVLGLLIWRGSNLARVLVMIGLTLSILSAAVGYFTMNEKITVTTTLLTLSFDILVLLALSSRDARNWSRVRTDARRAGTRKRTSH